MFGVSPNSNAAYIYQGQPYYRSHSDFGLRSPDLSSLKNSKFEDLKIGSPPGWVLQGQVRLICTFTHSHIYPLYQATSDLIPRSSTSLPLKIIAFGHRFDHGNPHFRWSGELALYSIDPGPVDIDDGAEVLSPPNVVPHAEA